MVSHWLNLRIICLKLRDNQLLIRICLKPTLVHALESAGVPAPFSMVLGNAETGAATGDLLSISSDLSYLLNRPGTPVDVTIKETPSEIAESRNRQPVMMIAASINPSEATFGGFFIFP